MTEQHLDPNIIIKDPVMAPLEDSSNGGSDAVKEKGKPTTEGDNPGVPHSSIEQEEVDDETDQIVFMVENMSPRQRRQTFDRLQPVLLPLFESTVIGKSSDSFDNPVQKSKAKLKQMEQSKADASHPTLITSSGDVTLSSGTSRVVIQTGSDKFRSKLKQFSGITPVPSGQVDYRTWSKSAIRLQKDSNTSDEEKLSRIQNSLVKPALDIVECALDSGSVTKLLSILESAYGSVEDPRDLLNNFNNSVQNHKESPSSYLSRLYLLCDELQRRGVVPVEDGPSMLLKQFVYGCTDDNLLLKLRLEEKEDDAPDYGTLLLTLRREEAKRTRRQMIAKRVVTQQLSTEKDDEVEQLRQEVKQLKLGKSVKTSIDSDDNEVVKLREEVAQLRQQVAGSCNQQMPTGNPSCYNSDVRSSQTHPKRKLRFCFKCGMDGHTVWKCNKDANPQLVCKRFEDAKNQGN